MKTPFKKQPKSIQEIIKDFLTKEMEKESKKNINIVILPTKIGQSSWRTRNFGRISTSNNKTIDQNVIVTPNNYNQISTINQSQISSSNDKTKNKSKQDKLVNITQQQQNQYKRKVEIQKTKSHRKSFSLNTNKSIYQKLPNLPRRINYFTEVAKSLELKFNDTIEGYQVEQDDMSFEIDEYVKMKYIKQIQYQEI
ncbi:unnamed protein product [Paramecium sonneborni]|uniref:Uncharacterized protein n=1 Tax=Paramecium sonneborni TaxID=65129 RepID=A0A8S1MAV1_9CILI|nr:unnamed protein product [Paramecium sonneborni]